MKIKNESRSKDWRFLPAFESKSSYRSDIICRDARSLQPDMLGGIPSAMHARCTQGACEPEHRLIASFGTECLFSLIESMFLLMPVTALAGPLV